MNDQSRKEFEEWAAAVPIGLKRLPGEEAYVSSYTNGAYAVWQHLWPQLQAARLVDIEKGARAISEKRYPSAPAVTPHSRNLAQACADAWGLEYEGKKHG